MQRRRIFLFGTLFFFVKYGIYITQHSSVDDVWSVC